MGTIYTQHIHFIQDYGSIEPVEKKDFIEWATKLAAGYHPSEAVRQQLAQVDLIALVGPTGVGKTTIISRLGIPYIASDVTRPQRDGEKNGHEYFFRSDYYDILKEIKAGEYAQFLVAKNGEFYGTRASSYPPSGPAVMAIIASAIPTFRTLGFRKVIPIYILPPSYIEWMHRIGTDRVPDFAARMSEARESLPMAFADPSYHLVLNDSLDNAVAEVQAIIAGQPVPQHRIDLARSSADQLFGRLGIDDDLLN